MQLCIICMNPVQGKALRCKPCIEKKKPCKQCGAVVCKGNRQYCGSCRNDRIKEARKKCVAKKKLPEKRCMECKIKIEGRKRLCPPCAEKRQVISKKKSLDKRKKQYAEEHGLKYTPSGVCRKCNAKIEKCKSFCAECNRQKRSSYNKKDYSKRMSFTINEKQARFYGIIPELKPESKIIENVTPSKSPYLQDAIEEFLSKGGKVKKMYFSEAQIDDLVIDVDELPKLSDVSW